MKKLITALLILSIAICIMPRIALAENIKTELYNFYGDNMLFQHSEEATISGTAKSGTTISFTMYNSHSSVVMRGVTEATEDNKFELSFMAPDGGYEEYSIDIFENEILFKTLRGVVFGEQWLACGQSNMHFPIFAEESWPDILETGSYGDKWTRFLYIVPYDTDTTETALYEYENIENCLWIMGDMEIVGAVSAIAYYFANKLREEIDMPVGVLCAQQGGAAINTFLSRDTVESNSDILKYLQDRGLYMPEGVANPMELSYFYSASTCYNTRIYPLRSFRLSGMIWHQGETDLQLFMQNYSDYSMLFNALQKNFTETFDYNGEKLPVVFSMLEGYNMDWSELEWQLFNCELMKLQNEDRASRAVVTVTDVPYDYTPENQAIHPIVKRPIGERMAIAAEGLVYQTRINYRAPSVKYTIKTPSAIYVVMNDVADGLICTGDELMGFSICGSDGIYYKADAKILLKNIVKISNDNIKFPKSAAYAISQNNSRSNLCSVEKGNLFMPASPFVTDSQYTKNLYYDTIWTDCEDNTAWFWLNENVNLSGEFDIWSGENCYTSVTHDARHSGNNGLMVEADAERFSVCMNYYKVLNDAVYFCGGETDNWASFGKLSFYIKSADGGDFSLDSVYIMDKYGYFYHPTVKINGKSAENWRRVELDISSCGLLSEVVFMKLNLKGDGASVIYIDSFEFSPNSTSFITRLMSILKSISR